MVSVERLMREENYREIPTCGLQHIDRINRVIFDHTELLTLTFDLLTSKSSQFISVPKCTL